MTNVGRLPFKVRGTAVSVPGVGNVYYHFAQVCCFEWVKQSRSNCEDKVVCLSGGSKCPACDLTLHGPWMCCSTQYSAISIYIFITR